MNDTVLITKNIIAKNKHSLNSIVPSPRALDNSGTPKNNPKNEAIATDKNTLIFNLKLSL